MRDHREAAAGFLVLANGDALPAHLLPEVAAALDAATYTIAADGGIHHAHRAGRDVDVLVGDLDSVDAETLGRARRNGTEVLVHPTDKDTTDLALALDLVLGRVADAGATGVGTPVLVIGGHGGRTDHLVANLLLLASDRYARLTITARWGEETVHIVRSERTLHGTLGATVSLLPMHGAATGVSVSGVRFPLHDATLEAGSTLGVSNELTDAVVHVTVSSGVLAVIQTHDVTSVHPRDEGER